MVITMTTKGNAMTANYGDENDDGVCEHEEWYIVEVENDGELNPSLVCCQIKCESCGTNGWLTAKVEWLNEHEVEWIA